MHEARVALLGKACTPRSTLSTPLRYSCTPPKLSCFSSRCVHLCLQGTSMSGEGYSEEPPEPSTEKVKLPLGPFCASVTASTADPALSAHWNSTLWNTVSAWGCCTQKSMAQALPRPPKTSGKEGL